MRRLFLALIATVLVCSASVAGPNANGTLVIALSEGIVYSSDNAPYCGSATATDCDSIVATTDGPGIHVLNVLAAFPDGSSPRLAGLTFGVTYNPADGVGGIGLLEWGGCGDFELPDGSWPASGSGTAVTWSSAQTSQLIETYWFAAYGYYYAAELLTLIPSPSQGASFADDDVPSNLDPIAGLGSFGFFGPGDIPCPSADVPAACCFADGSCEILLEGDCIAGGGVLEGSPSCDPNPCAQPPLGACCTDLNDCFLATEANCLAQGYDYVGDGSTCDPDPCGAIPTHRTTWGQIKAGFGGRK